MANIKRLIRARSTSSDRTKFTRPEGAGNFDNMDDKNIVDQINIKIGTSDLTPTDDKHIANKKYVDDEIDGKISDGTAAGQMSFWDGSKWVQTETSEMFWDDVNKRLGIGTASPSSKLHMFDGSNDVGIKLEQSTNIGGHVWWDTGVGYMYFDNMWNSNNGRILFRAKTSGVPVDMMSLRLSGDGNALVGVGLSTPDAAFHISQSASTSFLIDNTGVDDCSVRFRIPSVKEWAIGLDNSESDRFSIAESAALGTNDRLTIIAGGNIGIGTTTPATSAKLDITSTTGALLLPRMTTVQRNALTAINGMLIYDTTLNQIQGYENGAWRQL